MKTMGQKGDKGRWFINISHAVFFQSGSVGA